MAGRGGRHFASKMPHFGIVVHRRHYGLSGAQNAEEGGWKPRKASRRGINDDEDTFIDRKAVRRILEDNRETILKNLAEAEEKMDRVWRDDKGERSRRSRHRAEEEILDRPRTSKGKYGLFDEEDRPRSRSRRSLDEEGYSRGRRKVAESDGRKAKRFGDEEQEENEDEWRDHEEECHKRSRCQEEASSKRKRRQKYDEDLEQPENGQFCYSSERRSRKVRDEDFENRDRYGYREDRARTAGEDEDRERQDRDPFVPIGVPLAPEYTAWTRDDKKFQRRDDVSAGFTPRRWEWKEVESYKEAEAEIRQLRNREEAFYRQRSCIDTAQYGELLRRCGRTRNIEEGKRLHAKLAEGYFDRDTYLGNLLVQMYGDWGHVEAAREVFDKLDEKNVFSYNIMLAGYTRNGYLEQAREIFDMNKEKSVVSWNSMIAAYWQRGLLDQARRLFDEMPDKNVVSWTGMLQAYAKAGDLENAKSIFDKMEDKDLVTWNTMLAAFALTRGRLEEAKNLFDEMPVRDRVSWTTMMAAYNDCGLGQQALELFYRMLLDGLKPNNVTCIGIFYACTWIKSLKLARRLHRMLLENGLEPDVAVNTALVSMFAKCGSLSDAQDVFDSMAHRDTITWTTMVAALANQGNLEQAQALFQAMPDKNTVGWNTMVSSLVQVGKLDEARCMFNRMPDRNIFSWTAMIAGYAQAGQGVEALKLFAEMDLQGLYPDKVAFTSVLDACANIPAPVQGRAIYEDVVANGIDEDDHVMATTLLKLHSSCGKVEQAKKLFDGMICQDHVAWAAMVAAFYHNGREEQAVEMFREMLAHGLVPSGVAFITLFSACSHLGMLDEGRGYFLSMMEDYEIQPWLDHYLCMVDLLGRCGQLARAEELIETMPYERVAGAYRSLLSACKLHKDQTRAERAAKRASELEPKYGTPYVLLSNFHAQEGRLS